MAELKVLDFAVITRNIVDLGRPDTFFKNEEALEIFKEILPPTSEALEISTTVFNQVCSISKYEMVHLELPSIRIVQRPKIYFDADDKIVEHFVKNRDHTVQIFLTIHRSGALIINFHLHLQHTDGYNMDSALLVVRMNLATIAIEIPTQLCGKIPMENKPERIRYIDRPEGHFAVMSLKDLASEFIKPLVLKYLKNFTEVDDVRDTRCISSTLTQIYKTEPPCDNIREFVSLEKFGREIRGLGCLDRLYKSHPDNFIKESLDHDLASDEELAVYTFGLSDLILCDSTFSPMVDDTMKNKKIKDRYSGVLYHTMHYGCLFEWVYLEKYLIDLYSSLLSREIASAKTTPEQMLELQKLSMHDLIEYRSGITPYPSREEFLDKARQAHRIPEQQEKLEKKRDLATDYVIQEYTLRTNKSIQLVNIFISATAAFSFLQLVVTIYSPISEGDYRFWWIATGITFAVTLFLLWGINKFIMRRKY